MNNIIKTGLAFLAGATLAISANTVHKKLTDRNLPNSQIEEILEQHGDIKERNVQGRDRLYIITGDNHSDVDLKKNTLKAFGELYESGLVKSIGTEGMQNGETLEISDEVRAKYPYASKAEWDNVNDRRLVRANTKLLGIAYKDLPLVGIDDLEMLAENMMLFKDIPKGNSREERVKKERAKYKAYQKADERTEVMVDYLKNHPALTDTVGVVVGKYHVDYLKDLLGEKADYIVFHPHEGEKRHDLFKELRSDFLEDQR